MERLLSTPEAAKQLRRSEFTLKRWRRERTGPPYVLICGRVLYDPAHLERWIESSTIAPAVVRASTQA